MLLHILEYRTVLLPQVVTQGGMPHRETALSVAPVASFPVWQDARAADFRQQN